MSPSTQAISLSIPSSVYSSGSQVKGEVLLDFRQLMQDKIQEVHVKLRGFAQTYVHSLILSSVFDPYINSSLTGG